MLDYDVEKCQKGIVYIDEIDKIARKGDNLRLREMFPVRVSNKPLLKIIEGTVASVPPKGGRKHPQQEFVQVDTTNILLSVAARLSVWKMLFNDGWGKSLGFGADVRSTT